MASGANSVGARRTASLVGESRGARGAPPRRACALAELKGWCALNMSGELRPLLRRFRGVQPGLQPAFRWSARPAACLCRGGTVVAPRGTWDVQYTSVNSLMRWIGGGGCALLPGVSFRNSMSIACKRKRKKSQQFIIHPLSFYLPRSRSHRDPAPRRTPPTLRETVPHRARADAPPPRDRHLNRSGKRHKIRVVLACLQPHYPVTAGPLSLEHRRRRVAVALIRCTRGIPACWIAVKRVTHLPCPSAAAPSHLQAKLQATAPGASALCLREVSSRGPRARLATSLVEGKGDSTPTQPQPTLSGCPFPRPSLVTSSRSLLQPIRLVGARPEATGTSHNLKLRTASRYHTKGGVSKGWPVECPSPRLT